MQCASFAAVFLGMIGSVAVTSYSADNPYRIISEKNAFRLNPPPPPAPPAPPPPEEPVNLRFTGLSWHKDQVSAFLVINPVGPNATPTYLSLGPGEKSDGVELVSVNESSEQVTVQYQGKSRQISMEKALPAPAMGRLGGAPVVPAVPGAIRQPMAGVPGLNNAVANPTAGSPLANPRTMPGMAPAGANLASMNLPGRAVRGTQGSAALGGAVANPSPFANSGNTVGNSAPQTLEQSTIAVEVDRMVNQERIQRGEYPPLPPTGL